MNKAPSLTIFAILAGFSATAVHAETSTSQWISSSSLKGLVEIEAGFVNDYAGDSSSDIVVATVELAFDASLNDRVSAHVLLLHEEDATALEVDTATISIDLGKGLSLTAGQMYMPFGSYETNMVSDSLPHTFSETRESALLLGYNSGEITSSFYIFNGNVLETAADNTIESMGVNIVYDTGDMTAGISYTSNLTDSGLIAESLSASPAVSAYVAGLSLYATKYYDNISLFFEYITAIDEFDATDLVNGAAKPNAMNLEAGYDMGTALVAVAYQASREAVSFGLPETRLMLTYSTEIMKDTSLAFELASDSDYDLADGGSGESATTITAQLAVGF